MCQCEGVKVQIAVAARNAGKHWGMPAFSFEAVHPLLDMGARFISHQADILMIKNGLERIRAQFEPLGFTFDSRLPGRDHG